MDEPTFKSSVCEIQSDGNLKCDEKEVKAAQGRAIKRAIYTAIIYFVVVLVTVVMNLISAGETGNTGGWEACWNQAK